MHEQIDSQDYYLTDEFAEAIGKKKGYVKYLVDLGRIHPTPNSAMNHHDNYMFHSDQVKRAKAFVSDQEQKKIKNIK